MPVIPTFLASLFVNVLYYSVPSLRIRAIRTPLRETGSKQNVPSLASKNFYTALPRNNEWSCVCVLTSGENSRSACMWKHPTFVGKGGNTNILRVWQPNGQLHPWYYLDIRKLYGGEWSAFLLYIHTL